MKYRGIVTADNHVGSFKLKRYIYEYTNTIIRKLREEKIDFVILCGDWFDAKFYLNSEEAKVSIDLLMQLINLCKEMSIKLRIIYGTESHDAQQYQIFESFEKDSNYDFRIIYTVTEEELFDGVRVLYIPEEFVLDKNDYYKEFFDNRNYYDFVFGHGVIREGMMQAVKHMDKPEKEKRIKVPIFGAKELSQTCKGYVMFGHYHMHTEIIKDSVYYIGSLCRYKFGEEDDKGFYIIEKDTSTNEYNKTFIINCYSEKYDTLIYKEDNNVFNSIDSLEREIKKIDILLEAGKYERVKLKMYIPVHYEHLLTLKNTLNEHFRDDRVTIDIIEPSQILEEAEKDRVEEITEKYSQVLDKSVPIEEKLSAFIKKKNSVDIPLNRILQYMNCESIQEIEIDESEL